MRETMVSVVVLALVALAPMRAVATEDQAAPPPATQDQGAAAPAVESAPAKCLEAEVNPITGHVLCVKPRGAPVDPPNLMDEPCQKHANANGEWALETHCKTQSQE